MAAQIKASQIPKSVLRDLKIINSGPSSRTSTKQDAVDSRMAMCPNGCMATYGPEATDSCYVCGARIPA